MDTAKKKPGRPPKYDEPMVHLGIKIRASLKERINERAEAKGLSVTEVVESTLSSAARRWPTSSASR